MDFGLFQGNCHLAQYERDYRLLQPDEACVFHEICDYNSAANTSIPDGAQAKAQEQVLALYAAQNDSFRVKSSFPYRIARSAEFHYSLYSTPRNGFGHTFDVGHSVQIADTPAYGYPHVVDDSVTQDHCHSGHVSPLVAFDPCIAYSGDPFGHFTSKYAKRETSRLYSSQKSNLVHNDDLETVSSQHKRVQNDQQDDDKDGNQSASICNAKFPDGQASHSSAAIDNGFLEVAGELDHTGHTSTQVDRNKSSRTIEAATAMLELARPSADFQYVSDSPEGTSVERLGGEHGSAPASPPDLDKIKDDHSTFAARNTGHSNLHLKRSCRKDVLATPKKISKTTGKVFSNEKTVRDTPRKRAPTKGFNYIEGLPLPASWSEASEADKTLWNMKTAGKDWSAIRSVWLEMTGQDTAVSTLPNRYNRLKSIFGTLATDDDQTILEAKREVDQQMEAERWGRVAAMVETKSGVKYAPEFIKREFEKINAMSGGHLDR